MNDSEAVQLWGRLGSEGKAPTELSVAAHVLPSYTVGIDSWIDRLSIRYLRGDGRREGLSRGGAHFKLVLAPYGGGKTHFLLALGVRAREEGFAVSYIPCSQDISLANRMEVYRHLVRQIQLPDEDSVGLQSLLDSVVRLKRQDIERHGVSDVDVAYQRWVSTIRRAQYPENAFGRVMGAALGGWEEDSAIADSAFRWLQGDSDTLTRDELQELRLKKVPKADQRQLGQNLLLSMVKFLPNAGVHGLVLLMDEVETLFTARGKALDRILAAMRVLVDIPDTPPLLGVFSATPDVVEQFHRYPAIQQRLAVAGSPFDEGNDLATQLPLEKIQGQEGLLAAIGERLVEVGTRTTGISFDRELQRSNALRLAKVAARRNLDIDARRLYVKTWVGLLNLQASKGEREIGGEEMAHRYQGDFDALRENDQQYEP